VNPLDLSYKPHYPAKRLAASREVMRSYKEEVAAQ